MALHAGEDDDTRQRLAFNHLRDDDDDGAGAGAGGGGRQRQIVEPANLLAHNTLGFWGGVALVVSDIIGSGIFASPGIVLHWSGSVGASLALWVMVGGCTGVECS
jgi:hypothetical protein